MGPRGGLGKKSGMGLAVLRSQVVSPRGFPPGLKNGYISRPAYGVGFLPPPWVKSCELFAGRPSDGLKTFLELRGGLLRFPGGGPGDSDFWAPSNDRKGPTNQWGALLCKTPVHLKWRDKDTQSHRCEFRALPRVFAKFWGIPRLDYPQ